MSSPTPSQPPADLRAAVDAVLADARADLEALVRIPSIWADPAHAEDTRRSADAVATLARGAGAARVDVLAAEGGAPAVVAHWPGPDDAPTVMLYAHHDVQPTGGDELWTTAPFEPHERDEFARTFPGAAVLVTGVGDPASRWHGVDESLDLGMFGRCVLAEAMLLRSLAPGGR